MILSICIPTYNRAATLPNCLNSILISKRKTNLKFEICISDNGSNYNVKKIIKPFKKKLNIRVNRNKKNLGYALNLLKSVSMAKGEFAWCIGDDDLLVPKALKKINSLILKNKNIDFYYINSFHLNNNYLNKFKKPFDTNNLPIDMDRLSPKKNSQRLKFWDLIDHNVSFDFMAGNFVNIFRRKMWMDNVHVLDKKSINDKNSILSLLHLKIHANAFRKSLCYFHAEPLSVNLYGVREWGSLYPLIETLKLSESLDYYRSKGLNFFKYIYCKNYTLRNFASNLTKIIIGGKTTGLHSLNFNKHIFQNLLYPNVYLSIFYFIFRKIIILNGKIKKQNEN